MSAYMYFRKGGVEEISVIPSTFCFGELKKKKKKVNSSYSVSFSAAPEIAS